MLLIACSAVTTISADSSAAPQKKPETVIFTLNAIIQKFGQNEGQVYSVNRNPNTNIIESSIKIVPFRCSANRIQNECCGHQLSERGTFGIPVPACSARQQRVVLTEGDNQQRHESKHAAYSHQ